MSEIRADISKVNPYWIDKHRYYELKHFCLQYPTWKQLYLESDGYQRHRISDVRVIGGYMSDPTFEAADRKLYFQSKMEMVEQAAIQSDPELKNYILRAVTEGLSFTFLKARLEIPCGKDMYYDRYRRFFWLLSRLRG